MSPHADKQIYWDDEGLQNPYSGIGVYARRLYLALKKDQGVLPQILSFENEISGFDKASIKQLEKPRFLPAQNILRHLTKAVAYKKDVDCIFAGQKKVVFHGLANTNIPFAAKKNAFFVLTVHDLIPLIVPTEFSLKKFARRHFITQKALARADAIIAISQWTKDSLTHFFPQVESKVFYVPHGCDHKEFLKTVDPGLAINPQETTQIIAVSRFERYKRLDLVLDVTRRVPNNFVTTLVTDERGEEFARRYAQDLIAKRKLVVLTNVNTDTMRQLMLNSALLLHPSLYEGYCFPAIEALSCGLPVIYTEGSATLETVGKECGQMLSPKAKISEWVEAVLGASHLKFTVNFQEKIKEHFKSLPTWQETAKKTAGVYFS